MSTETDSPTTAPSTDDAVAGDDDSDRHESRESGATEGDLNRKANKWAGLGERYQYHRDQLREQRATRRAAADDDAAEDGDSRRLYHRLADGVHRLTRRLHSHTRTVTDIETKPPLDTSSPEAVEAGEHTVDMVRFELDDDEYTYWYSWEPQRVEHPLTRIIDYYADGDLSVLHNTTVTIAYDMQGEPGDARQTPCILYPSPYDRRSGHLKYSLFTPLFTLDNPDEHMFTRVTATDDQRAFPTITADTDYRPRLSHTAWNYIGSLAVVLGVWGLGMGIVLEMDGDLGPVALSTLLFGGYALLFGVPYLLNKRLEDTDSGTFLYNVYSRALKGLFFPLFIAVRGLLRGLRGMRRKLNEFDKRDSI